MMCYSRLPDNSKNNIVLAFFLSHMKLNWVHDNLSWYFLGKLLVYKGRRIGKKTNINSTLHNLGSNDGVNF